MFAKFSSALAILLLVAAAPSISQAQLVYGPRIVHHPRLVRTVALHGQPVLLQQPTGVSGSAGLIQINAGDLIGQLLNRGQPGTTINTSNLESQLTSLRTEVTNLTTSVNSIHTKLDALSKHAGVPTPKPPAPVTNGFQVDPVGGGGAPINVVPGQIGGSAGVVTGSSGEMYSPDDLRKLADQVQLQQKIAEISKLKAAYADAKAAGMPEQDLVAMKKRINALIDQYAAGYKIP